MVVPDEGLFKFKFEFDVQVDQPILVSVLLSEQACVKETHKGLGLEIVSGTVHAALTGTAVRAFFDALERSPGDGRGRAGGPVLDFCICACVRGSNLNEGLARGL